MNIRCVTEFGAANQLKRRGFGQNDESATRTAQGLGMGLQCVQHILDAFPNSSIGVQSKSVGSIVWVRQKKILWL